jgi:ribose transport system permease protein
MGRRSTTLIDSSAGSSPTSAASGEGATVPPAAAGGGARRTAAPGREVDWVRVAQTWGMLAVLVLMIVVFSILRPDTFPTTSNLQSLVNNQAVLILVAMSAMLALVVGGFDLSITSVVSMAGVLAIGLQGRTHLAWPVASVLCLGVGVGVGLVNGMIVAKLRLNSFVVTLATQTIVVGLITWYTKGEVLFMQVSPDFLHAGQNKAIGFVYPVFLAIVIVAALWYLLEQTPTGRQMYATGANYDAARLAGVPTVKITVVAFVLAGVVAALAGVVQAAKIGSGQPDIGSGYLLPAFASAFLGASAVRVGRFNPLGTLLGVLLVATGFNGLVLLDVALWVQPVFYGLVLLIAIATPVLAERSRRRRSAVPAAEAGAETVATPPGAAGTAAP